jgi:two-component system response regulator GlrR
MKELTLTIEQTSLVSDVTPTTPALTDDATLLTMPLTEAKRLSAAKFERSYLLHVMERAQGSVSAGARLSGLDRTNFRRLLQRHGLRPVSTRSEE